MVVGIYFLRHRRAKAGLPPAPYRAWHSALILSAAVCLFILIMPWYPPKKADVSFWYATYCVVGIGLIVAMGIYYFVWIQVLPKIGKYQIRTETLVSDKDGSVTHRLKKVPNAEVEEWDRTHDGAGDVLGENVGGAVGGDHLIRRVRVKEATGVNVEVGKV